MYQEFNAPDTTKSSCQADTSRLKVDRESTKYSVSRLLRGIISLPKCIAQVVNCGCRALHNIVPMELTSEENTIGSDRPRMINQRGGNNEADRIAAQRGAYGVVACAVVLGWPLMQASQLAA